MRDRRREDESLVAGAVVRTRTLGHTRTEDHDRLTGRIIGCAIEVHRLLGPGLLERAYEEALSVELEEAGLAYQCQLPVPILHQGRTLGEYRLDLLVEDTVVVGVKSTERDDSVFMSQLLTYIRLTGKKVGLLINCNRRLVKDGITRMVVSRPNSSVPLSVSSVALWRRCSADKLSENQNDVDGRWGALAGVARVGAVTCASADRGCAVWWRTL